MQATKKNTRFLAFLLLAVAFNACGMDPEPEKKSTVITGIKQLIRTTRNTLLGTQSEPFPFTDLPEDLQKNIHLLSIYTTAESLETAAYTVNSLAQVNKELNTLMNDSRFCLQLIKHLAIKFNCSDATVANALQTKEAKRRLNIQKDLQKLCISTGSKKNALESLLQQHVVDFEFTYDLPKFPGEYITPLMMAAATCSKPYDIIDVLLAHTANINFGSNKGRTALIIAAQYKNIACIEKLIKNKNIAINQQDLHGNTALLCSLDQSVFSAFGDLADIVQLLLNAGADPELDNFDGLTPLQAAQNNRDQDVISLILNAIDKKYEKK